jgi:hypothetical protein
MMLRRALCLTAFAIGGVPSMALAHPGPSATVTIETWEAALCSAIPGLLLLGAAILLACIAASRSRLCRYATLVGLVLLLALTGFETSVHSVHHLGDAPAAERCVVASTAAHLHAVDVASPVAAGNVVSLVGQAPVMSVLLCGSPARASIFGRAPPA